MFELISNPYILYLYVVPFFFNFGYVIVDLIQDMSPVTENEKYHWSAMTLFAFALILLPVVNLIFMLYSIYDHFLSLFSRKSKHVS
jgi:hypothetical protein